MASRHQPALTGFCTILNGFGVRIHVSDGENDLRPPEQDEKGDGCSEKKTHSVSNEWTISAAANAVVSPGLS